MLKQLGDVQESSNLKFSSFAIKLPTSFCVHTHPHISSNSLSQDNPLSFLLLIFLSNSNKKKFPRASIFCKQAIISLYITLYCKRTKRQFSFIMGSLYISSLSKPLFNPYSLLVILNVFVMRLFCFSIF